MAEHDQPLPLAITEAGVAGTGAAKSDESTALVDALPYFDLGYDEPGVRDAAIQLVEEEARRYRPTRNYLEHLGAPEYHKFETEIMKSEYERIQNRLPMELLSMKRYELPPPTAGKMTDVSAWLESVENSQAQLEHQALRIINLELMVDLGGAKWRHYNELLVKLVEDAQKKLQELHKEIQAINWQRKKEQSEVGKRLKQLEETWVTLVSKNYEIERVCAQLTGEVNTLKREKLDAEL